MSSDESDGVLDDNQFYAVYNCYSPAFLTDHDRINIEKGGKILLPQPALEHLVEKTNIMLFKLKNPKNNRLTHCGVLEFIASEEPICYLPCWMMNHLQLNDGDELSIESVHSIPMATFVRFQPQSKDFLDISNPRAVLEHVLRNFSCLTKGDMVPIDYLDRKYELSVLELKPSNAVSIVECDMEVDFAPSIDYVGEKKSSTQTATNDEQGNRSSSTFRPFSGQGTRLSGKVKVNDNEQNTNAKGTQKRGVPNYDYKYGLLRFPRIPLDSTHNDINEILDRNSSTTFQPFIGEGKVLRQPRNQKPN
ncbi:unnamed protein product [Rotaria socialis]|uniref:Ubiquitin fusion degradaton protein n=1 Tax=Rotaria socialis TaxID=392032 RepID=A0A817NV89_9BILA|nr:unnamed protein product [Rotaria socialis]CAF3237930.1 unnamed protein product [Rotaria socialis]CAF3316409.1 unnamed protein product [Rotaria socialis]CAF3542256.1 unnamed protein product [Rotaria socialis]CAF4241534.1 unnamed protein product [Rotaria socialis]